MMPDDTLPPPNLLVHEDDAAEIVSPRPRTPDLALHQDTADRIMQPETSFVIQSLQLSSINTEHITTRHEQNTPVEEENDEVNMLAAAAGDRGDEEDLATQLIVPEVGMAFESEGKAYEMYNTYAGKIGFSIRKHTTKHRPSDGTIYQKYLVCSSEGHQKKESTKGTTRTGCNARVQFSVSKEGIWSVQKVVLEHNHYLASPDKTKKMRSQRRITEADRKLINQVREAGMKPSQVYEFMKEFYGGEDKVPYSRMDCNNEIGRERNKYLESNDAQTLCNYLKNKQLEDPTFFYAIQLDTSTGRIVNFFWADGQSIMDYACFGDAVSFDTTFQTNKFEMPFAPILGTNHHKQTIIFGAALLFDESIPSFVWLFETFLIAMSGKHPSTIFTDQDAAMAGAIAYVFPNTSHRLCLWHIYLNAAKHLGHVIELHPMKFLPAFKSCIHEDRSEFYFNKKWQDLLMEYNLQDNEWMSQLYDLREKWAIIFRDSFTADMTSTQRSEGMNNVFKKRFRRKLGLSELLVECEKVSASLRSNELDADFQTRRKSLVPYSPSLPMLKRAAESYTKRMFLEFEAEFKDSFVFTATLLETDGSILRYMVMHMQSNYGATVVFNTEDMNIKCSCKKYESIGILCKHALRVFNIKGVFDLPPQYIHKRWTKYAKRGFYVAKKGTAKENLTSQVARISRKATTVALKCSPWKELLDGLEEAIDKLDLEADNSTIKMQEKANEVPLVSTHCATDTLTGKISFRVPQVVKGPKYKRGTISLEKRKGKKRKSGKKKGDDSNNAAENKDEDADPKELMDFNANNMRNVSSNVYVESSITAAPSTQGEFDSASMMPYFNMYTSSSAMDACVMQGGYTSLLLGVDQDATSAARKLQFDSAK